MLTRMSLVQRQFNRYERKLAAVMAPGEKILAYDVGRFDDGRGVNALASTHAFYCMFNGAGTVRVAYPDMLALHTPEPGFIAHQRGLTLLAWLPPTRRRACSAIVTDWV